MTTLTVYGIPNCDSVKKARAWFSAQNQAHVFHDFKKQGLSAELLALWLKTLDWQTLLNRKGTMWRRLDDASRAAVVDVASASALMLNQPSIIKRPVVHWPDGTLTVGFDPVKYMQWLHPV